MSEMNKVLEIIVCYGIVVAYDYRCAKCQEVVSEDADICYVCERA